MRVGQALAFAKNISLLFIGTSESAFKIVGPFKIIMALLFESDGTPYVMLGDNKIQSERMPITEQFYVNKARRELRETDKNFEIALRELRALLKGK